MFCMALSELFVRMSLGLPPPPLLSVGDGVSNVGLKKTTRNVPLGGLNFGGEQKGGEG